MRAPLPILLALTATLLGPLSAHATGVPVPLPPADEVTAGDVVTTAVPSLPPGTREFELVLLPEGGAPIAVSPELPAGVVEVRWTMPRTYAGRARLVLRVGDEATERWLAPSAWFALTPATPSELAHLVVAGSEDVPHPQSGGALPAGWSGTADSATLGACVAAPAAVAAPPGPAVATAQRAAARRETSRSPGCGAGIGGVRANVPLRVPLRN